MSSGGTRTAGDDFLKGSRATSICEERRPGSWFDQPIRGIEGADETQLPTDRLKDASPVLLAGLTREEYERETKRIRLRMYAETAKLERADASTRRTVVLVGHHLDDCDENRVEQLAAGHLLGDLRGMNRVAAAGAVVEDAGAVVRVVVSSSQQHDGSRRSNHPRQVTTLTCFY